MIGYGIVNLAVKNWPLALPMAHTLTEIGIIIPRPIIEERIPVPMVTAALMLNLNDTQQPRVILSIVLPSIRFPRTALLVIPPLEAQPMQTTVFPTAPGRIIALPSTADRCPVPPVVIVLMSTQTIL